MSAAKDLVLDGHLPGRTNGEFHVIFGLVVIIAAMTRREWFHKLLAPALGMMFLLYITLLYARLQLASTTVGLHKEGLEQVPLDSTQ